MADPQLILDDDASIRDYLGSFDLFVGIKAEGFGYLFNSWRRFMITFEMIPSCPASGGRLLELGANPYFLTLMMKKLTKYKLSLSNYFGESGPPEGYGIQTLRSPRYDEQHEFRYEHFNGEVDNFPYPDHSFDVVLNCEILEHVTLDPTHFLCECHRVLRPGGHLLLTTPNVLALQNLWKLATNRTIYDQYSGYGVYGRHNREYAPREVIDLLQACGFIVRQVRLEDILPHRGLTRWLKRFRQHWRDNIFVLAQTQGRPLYNYPDWLYRSMVNLRRVVRSDIVMGENDSIQLGQGWYPLERETFAFRWTTDRAYAYLLDIPQATHLVVEVLGWDQSFGPTTIVVSVGSTREVKQLQSQRWQEIAIPLPGQRSKELEVVLQVSPVWVPSQLGINQDNRTIGVAVKRLWLK